MNMSSRTTMMMMISKTKALGRQSPQTPGRPSWKRWRTADCHLRLSSNIILSSCWDLLSILLGQLQFIVHLFKCRILSLSTSLLITDRKIFSFFQFAQLVFNFNFP